MSWRFAEKNNEDSTQILLPVAYLGRVHEKKVAIPTNNENIVRLSSSFYIFRQFIVRPTTNELFSRYQVITVVQSIKNVVVG